VGFELGHFPAVLHNKEIAENPCKHWYLSTPPSFTCFSNFTPFNYFFDFLELMADATIRPFPSRGGIFAKRLPKDGHDTRDFPHPPLL
jgi:hypothetical protein